MGGGGGGGEGKVEEEPVDVPVMYSTQPNHGVGPTAPSLRSSLHKYLAGQSSNSVVCVCVCACVCGGSPGGKVQWDAGSRGRQQSFNYCLIESGESWGLNSL